MSDADNSIKGSPPVVFDIPTLGRAVRLGELYDARSGKFLGVQLYAQDKVKQVETNIRHTELTVSLSTTHQQKATLLDINAELSLEVLGGLVKVSGSASYLNDEKSNTHEYAYALALKMRLREERILFAEDDLGRNVLRVAEKDYINTKLATHFVSSIVYGGNYIVNLVARQSEMTKEEKIEGKLQASFDHLKGAISLSGSVEAEIKGEFSDMDDKFDLVVHGDVALDKVPVTPKDVLDTFSEAASLITDSGGVPISVTLQPIPADLYKAGLIFKIEDDLVDTVLAAFSGLDDLHSRFLVLQDSTKRLHDFVPKLDQAVRAATTTYIEEHSKLLHRLMEFLQDYKLGNKLDHAPLLADVNALYNEHVLSDNKSSESSDTALQYPSTLVGLEDQLLRIQHLITDIRRVRGVLSPPDPTNPENPGGNKPVDSPVNRSFYLSSFEDVCGSIRTQSETPIFIMPPISSNAKHHRLVIKYLAIVRKHAYYFNDPVNIAHMFYTENPEYVKDALDGDESSGEQRLPELNVPSLIIAKVDEDGELTWVLSPPPPPPPPPPSPAADTFVLTQERKLGDVNELMASIDLVGSTQDFTFQIRVKAGTDSNKDESNLIVQCARDQYFHFKRGFSTVLFFEDSLDLSGRKRTPGEEFLVIFQQDMKDKSWTLYLDEEMIATKYFTEEDICVADKLQIHTEEGKGWWDGQLLEFKAFAFAPSPRDLYLAWKNSQT